MTTTSEGAVVVRDLVERTGLPLGLAARGRLEFREGLPPVAPQARTLEEMRPVLYNQTAGGPDELYLMYRGVGWPGDAARFSSLGLRFDVTVLLPGLVGGEYIKTAGHYHPDGYPELYQVVHGQAHYLLQKRATRPAGEEPRAGGTEGPADDAALVDVVVVEAGPGQALFVPPGYGHVTINPGTEPLVMVNVVDRTFASVYEPYRRRHGAAYYEVEVRDDANVVRAVFVPNDHYSDPPKPRLVQPTRLQDLGLSDDEPLYPQLAREPEVFGFLSPR